MYKRKTYTIKVNNLVHIDIELSKRRLMDANVIIMDSNGLDYNMFELEDIKDEYSHVCMILNRMEDPEFKQDALKQLKLYYDVVSPATTIEQRQTNLWAKLYKNMSSCDIQNEIQKSGFLGIQSAMLKMFCIVLDFSKYIEDVYYLDKETMDKVKEFDYFQVLNYENDDIKMFNHQDDTYNEHVKTIADNIISKIKSSDTEIKNSMLDLVNKRTTLDSKNRGSTYPIWIVQKNRWNISENGDGTACIIDSSDGEVYSPSDISNLIESLDYDSCDEALILINSAVKNLSGTKLMQRIANITGLDGPYIMEKQWEFCISEGDIFLTYEAARKRVAHDDENTRLYAVCAHKDPHIIAMEQYRNANEN